MPDPTCATAGPTDSAAYRPLSPAESTALGIVKCLNCRFPLGSATDDRFFAGSAIMALPVDVTCPVCGQVRRLRLPGGKGHGRTLAGGGGGNLPGAP